MRIGVLGMAGRMGTLVIEEAMRAGHQVIGGTLHPGSASGAPAEIPVMDLATLSASSDAVIDFTHASTTVRHAAAMSAAGIAWIIGTTGLSRADDAVLVDAGSRIPVLYAAHFGLGINLLAAIARQLGAALPPETYDAEIVEMHHRQKGDAPSGSAIVLGRAVAEGRGVQLEDVMECGRDGHTGPRQEGAIGFAALRGGQVVGEHTLLFASAGEHITLNHRVLDRRIFAAGAVRAAEWLQGRPPALYSIADMLGAKASASEGRG